MGKGFANDKHPDKESTTDTWLTPPYIIEALGPFDLDPCSPIGRPWDTAKIHLTKEDDGLQYAWGGLVWCNPPYSQLADWVVKSAKYGNVIMLTYARTETIAFHSHVWPLAHSIFFFKGRIKFYRIDGTIGDNPSAPSMLIAFNEETSFRIKNSNLTGKYIQLK